MLSDSESEMTNCHITDKPKKRQKTFRSNDVVKKLRIASLSTGEDCKCQRFKCFQEVPEFARRQIIKNFNGISSHNEQSLYLSGFISLIQVPGIITRTPIKFDLSMMVMTKLKVVRVTV